MLKIATDKCCGCGACAVVCPQKCISMVENKEGFLYPYIQTEICLNCELCNSVCPVNRKKIDKTRSPHAYLAYNLDEKKRKQASSGGVFIELASAVISESGSVYGVVCTPDLITKHVRAEQIEDVYPMMGSKYVQSVVGDTFELALQDLEKGKKVLYSGTPCQIAGLLGYLKAKKVDCSDKLITVDTLCHGVPSPKVLKSYINQFEQQCGEKVDRISFRDKRTGWQNYSVVLSTKNYEQSCDANSDAYMLAFRKNLSLRQSCYVCPFKLGNQFVFADITLGDFWGVGREFKEYESDDRGISWITVHNDKGNQLMNMVINHLNIKEVSIEVPLRNNASATYPALLKPSRALFFIKLERTKDFKKMVHKMAGETGLEGFFRRAKRWVMNKI